jgi:uracil phosphoribosyltransferase
MIGVKVAQPIAIVPIMRAGLAMVEPLLRLLPEARVWHLGLYRDEETLRPVPYYNRAMRSGQAAHCIVVDPMLATGGSAVSAVELVKEVGAERITYIGIVAAPYGVARLTEAHPDVEIYVAALDRELNEQDIFAPASATRGIVSSTRASSESSVGSRQSSEGGASEPVGQWSSRAAGQPPFYGLRTLF